MGIDFFLGVIYVGVLATGAYAITLLRLGYVNLQQSGQQQKWSLLADLPNVSVIIAFRNEAQNIPALWNGLTRLQYPPEKLEIILVDDHSDDESASILTNLISEQPGHTFRLYSIPAGKCGKKAALETGVLASTGSWLLFTDADCELHPNWLTQMVTCQQNSQAHMVCGPVAMRASSWAEKLEATEFASLITVGAISLAIGRPSLCNGANYMIWKGTYFEAHQNREDFQLAGGDDVFLLHALKKMGRKIAFCFIPYSEITIAPSSNWNHFVQQRIRWASKWKSGISGANRALAVLVWLFHVLFIGMTIGLFARGHFGWALNLAALKAASETQFLELFLPEKSYRKNILRILSGQFLYSFYVIYFGILVLFSNQYTWKGRQIHY